MKGGQANIYKEKQLRVNDTSKIMVGFDNQQEAELPS